MPGVNKRKKIRCIFGGRLVARISHDRNQVVVTARKLLSHQAQSLTAYKPVRSVEEYNYLLQVSKDELNGRLDLYFEHLDSCEVCRNAEGCPDPIRDSEAYEDWKVAYRARSR